MNLDSMTVLGFLRGSSPGWKRECALGVLILLAATLSARAGDDAGGGHTGRLIQLSEEPGGDAPAREEWQRSGGGAIVDWGRALPDESRKCLEEQGAILAGVLPGPLYLWSILPGCDVEAVAGPIRSLQLARDAGPIHGCDIAAGAADRIGADIPVWIRFWPRADVDSAAAKLGARGVRIDGIRHDAGVPRLAVRVPRSKVAGFLDAIRDPSLGVLHAEYRPRTVLRNDRSVGTIQSGVQLGSTPLFALGIIGEGEIVGIIDTGLDVDSCYFADTVNPVVTNTATPGGVLGTAVSAIHRKIRAYDFLYSCDEYPGATQCDRTDGEYDYDNHGHGTHVSGNALGGKGFSPGQPYAYSKFDGMAPGAMVVMQDGGYIGSDACSDLVGLGCPLTSLVPFFEQAYAQGARVHTNSYGDNEDATAPKQSNYSERSADVDLEMWNRQDLLILFAAGNSGTEGFGSVGSPSTAKNGLSIGSGRNSAYGSDEDVSYYSSLGPTADGRFKPDLIAPGYNTSAHGDKDINTHQCQYESGAGTSFASPTAAGAAALVREYLRRGFYPTGSEVAADGRNASAALVKALLVNGAVSMTGKFAGSPIESIPSRVQGWGRIELDDALYFAGDDRKLFLADTPTASGFGAGAAPTRETSFSSYASSNLKITLVWTDYPGIPRSWNDPASVLVNDLDLRVTAPDGTEYLGNVTAGGFSVAGGAADRKNNVEQIWIEAPMDGLWSIAIDPHLIAVGPQAYALVVTGEGQLEFPKGGRRFPFRPAQ